MTGPDTVVVLTKVGRTRYVHVTHRGKPTKVVEITAEMVEHWPKCPHCESPWADPEPCGDSCCCDCDRPLGEPATWCARHRSGEPIQWTDEQWIVFAGSVPDRD